MTETAYADLPKTKREAIAAGVHRYFTGKPCKYGHVAPRQVGNRSCVVCDKAYHDEWRKRNPEKARAKYERWLSGLTPEERAVFEERQRAKARAFYYADIEASRASSRERSRRLRRDAACWRALLDSPLRFDPAVADAIRHIERELEAS